MQSLCLNVEVLSQDGSTIEMRDAEEDVFRAAEELGIDLSAASPARSKKSDHPTKSSSLRSKTSRGPRSCGHRPRPGKPGVSQVNNFEPELPEGLQPSCST